MVTWALSEIHYVEAENILDVGVGNGQIILCSEKSKIKYYLPAIYSENDFNTYLSNLGLSLVDCRQKNSWILFNIKELDTCQI